MSKLLAVSVAVALVTLPVVSAAQSRLRHSSRSPLLSRTRDEGRAPADEEHHVVVSMALRNRAALESFLVDVQDPTSPLYHRFLTPPAFAAAFGPTAAEEAAVVEHLERHGLAVTDRFPNRLLVGASGKVRAIERAFGVELHRVDLDGARHYAAVSEPTLPAELAAVVEGVLGLDDLTERRPHVTATPSVAPGAALGRAVALAPPDLVTFYDEAVASDGAGTTIAIAGAFAWGDADNGGFASHWSLPSLPAGSGQICTGSGSPTGCAFSSKNSIEIALDAEYAHATAPGARILNYMAASTANADFSVMYNRIVSDGLAQVVTTSWGTCEAHLSTASQQSDDSIFAQANAIGQAWVAASGDLGSRDCSGIVGVDNPANSPHVMGVGGTTPTCSSGLTGSSPACGGWGGETGWSGSGGGVSRVFARPAFQAGCGVPAGTTRLVPDVALESDTSPGNFVLEGGSWFIVGGTSGAAPQWAGVLARLTERIGGPLGNPGHVLYGACGTAAYHDVSTGSNGDFTAGPGYDLVTGLGTVDVKTFVDLVTSTTGTTTTTLNGCR